MSWPEKAAFFILYDVAISAILKSDEESYRHHRLRSVLPEHINF